MKKLSKTNGVLIVGPGSGVRGGITSVIKVYQRNSIIRPILSGWLETYDDRSHLFKIFAAIKAFGIAPKLILKSTIIHIHCAGDVSVYRKFIFFLIAKALRKKIIIHLHTAESEPFFRGLQNLISKILFKHADQIIVLSEYWKQIIKKITPEAKVCILANPYSLSNNSKKRNSKQNSKHILFMGKLEDRKGFCDLINAVPKIISEVPKIKLVMAGHGDINGGKKLAKKLNVSSSIQFLGWVQGAEKEKLFEQASVFCLPSYNEGVPMAMLEAMGNGLPVVVTPVGGISDVIVDKKNGLFVSPGNVQEIENAIIKLLKNDEYAKHLKKKALLTIKENYTEDAICTKLYSIYLTMIN